MATNTLQPVPTYGTQALNAPTGQVNVYDPNTGKPLAGAQAYNPNTGAKIQEAPINANIVGNTSPINYDSTKLSNTVGDSYAKLGATAEGAMTPAPTLEQKSADTMSKTDTIYNRILGTMGLLEKKGERTAEIQAEEDVFAKKQKARELEGKYDKTKKSYEDRIDKLRENAQGMLSAGLNNQIYELERKRDDHLSDIALDYKVSIGAYNDAIEIVNSKVEAEFAPLEDGIKNLTALYGLVQNDMSESEQIAAQSAIQQKQADVDYQRTIARDALLHKYGLAEIYARASAEKAATTGGGTVSTPAPTYALKAGDDPWNIAVQNGITMDELKRLNPQISDWRNIGVGVKLNLPVTSTQKENDFVQTMLNTAGGKALTDTSIQKLDKGLTVLGQIGVLQTNIANTKTGPITGAFRGANPWDTNAQTIKASLNAVVPNLARGVYGEVGVLTDNDIKNYSKTLPTLNSTEAVRNAILYITLDMIGKSIQNTLSVNAAAGRDVSGFVDIYTEMQSTKNSILNTIPKTQVPTAFNSTNPIGAVKDSYQSYLDAIR